MAGQTKEKPMKARHQFIHRLKDQRGVSAVIVAIVLALLIGFGALAVDLGYLYATKNELQNIADAAALAGAGMLGVIYADMSFGDQQSYNCADDTYDDVHASDVLSIEAAALGVVDGLKNRAGWAYISIRAEDILINQWNGTPFEVDYLYQPDAVRVIARRDGILNNPLTMWFAKLIGTDSVQVNADATAALTAPTSVAPGVLKLPVALSINHFRPIPCDPDDPPPPIIHLSPTDTCAGWHNFFDAINANAMRWKLLGFIKEDPYQPPDQPPEDPIECALPPCGGDWLIEKFGWTQAEVDALDSDVTAETDDSNSFEFQGGDIGTLFTGAALWWQDEDGCTKCDPVEDLSGQQLMIPNAEGQQPPPPYYPPAPIIALFDYFRFRDGDAIWTTTIPIYKDDEGGCLNPNTLLGIEGFTQVEVSNVNPQPGRTLDVLIDCDMKIIHARGGGGPGIVKGSIPNLVE
jgi:hypothetical protein